VGNSRAMRRVAQSVHGVSVVYVMSAHVGCAQCAKAPLLSARGGWCAGRSRREAGGCGSGGAGRSVPRTTTQRTHKHANKTTRISEGEGVRCMRAKT
jgi:hypothetical protein